MFSSEVIFELIKYFDPNIAHINDKIFVNMFKLCDPSICKPLILLFEYYLAPEHFHDI